MTGVSEGLEGALRGAALSGDIESQYLYAKQWVEEGNPFNFEVFICLKKAADQDHRDACRLLALVYCENQVLTQTFHPNFDLMMDYLVRSVGSDTKKRSLKSVLALPGLKLTSADVVKILEFVHRSDAPADTFCDFLGVIGESVHRRVIEIDDASKPNFLRLFEDGVKSGAKNSGSAAYGLAILYYIGVFGLENRSKCFSLFRAAIFASYRKAEPYMALCCLEGIGMKADQSQALVHLNKALEDERAALDFANTFITIGDSSPFKLFKRTLDSPQAKYIAYKFITRLKCKSKRDPMELLKSSAASQYPPAVKALGSL